MLITPAKGHGLYPILDRLPIQLNRQAVWSNPIEAILDRQPARATGLAAPPQPDANDRDRKDQAGRQRPGGSFKSTTLAAFGLRG
jgi:hypothetical protein